MLCVCGIILCSHKQGPQEHQQRIRGIMTQLSRTIWKLLMQMRMKPLMSAHVFYAETERYRYHCQNILSQGADEVFVPCICMVRSRPLFLLIDGHIDDQFVKCLLFPATLQHFLPVMFMQSCSRLHS